MSLAEFYMPFHPAFSCECSYFTEPVLGFPVEFCYMRGSFILSSCSAQVMKHALYIKLPLPLTTILICFCLVFFCLKYLGVASADIKDHMKLLLLK